MREIFGKVKELLKKYREQVLYIVFGAVTTLVNIIVYALCTRFGLSAGVSNVIAWVLSVATAFVTNRRYVFEDKGNIIKEALMFASCRIGTGLLDQLIVMAGVDWYGAAHIASDMQYAWGIGVKLVSNVIVIILNYVFSKLWVFRKK